MYFLCHAWSDNEVVDPVAKEFIHKFGETKVFYDRWNIQPGDSIIGGVNEALEKCEVFFFFFGVRSLSRAMVNREWQSALSRFIKGKNKFVIIRLDNVDPPAIVDDLALIDMFSCGAEDALRQMIAIIDGEKVMDISKAEPFRNLVCRIISQSPTGAVVEVRARRFAAQSPTIGVHIPSLKIDEYDVQLAKIDEIHQVGVLQYRLPDGQVKIEMRQVTLMRPIELGKPLWLRISFKKSLQSLNSTIYHFTGGACIPVPPEE